MARRRRKRRGEHIRQAGIGSHQSLGRLMDGDLAGPRRHLHQKGRQRIHVRGFRELPPLPDLGGQVAVGAATSYPGAVASAKTPVFHEPDRFMSRALAL